MSVSSDERSASCTAKLPARLTLHARPAGRFVVEATRFHSTIVVTANGRRANAKSILEVLALGATGGTVLHFAASGEDATEAVAHLAGLLRMLGQSE